MGAIEDWLANVQGKDYYDNRLAAAARAAQMRSADLQSQYSTGRENIEGNYNYEKNLIGQGLDKALVNLGGSFADRGTLRSSVYGDETANTQNVAQQQLMAAALRRTQGMTSLESALRSGNTDLLSGLQLEEADSVGRRAQAQHQAELERRQQEYNQYMMDLQRQQVEQQNNYYAQQADMQNQMAQQQADYYNQMVAAMQPVASPTGQMNYPQNNLQEAAKRKYPSIQTGAGKFGKIW